MSSPQISDSTSYGLVLFNSKGQILVLKRKWSYGFSSIFSMLRLEGTTAERPDQFIQICKQLIDECTVEERDLLKSHWAPEKFPELLDLYLEGLPIENLQAKTRKGFRHDELKVKLLWGCLIRGLPVPQENSPDQSRVHDIPKGRHCKTIIQVRSHAEGEIGRVLPHLDYGKLQSVSYTPVTGVTYQVVLIPAKCSDFEVNPNICEWLEPKRAKLHKTLLQAIENTA